MSRSPRGQRPLRRTMSYWSRSHRSTPAVSCREVSLLAYPAPPRPAPRRLDVARRLAGFFLKVVPWRSKKRQPRSGYLESAASSSPPRSHSAFGYGCSSIRGQKSLGIIVQNRTAAPTRLRRRHAVIVPSLQPFDRRTRADLEALSRLVPRRALFYRSNTRSRRSPEYDFGIVGPEQIAAKSMPMRLAHSKRSEMPIQFWRNLL